MTESRTLLIIEDQPYLRSSLEYFLGKVGYTVLAAKDAEKGLKICAEHHPQALLMDINLPGMDGFSATRKIRHNPATSEMEVVYISASPPQEIIEKGMDTGARFFIGKPADPEDIAADLYFLFNSDFNLAEADFEELRVARPLKEETAVRVSVDPFSSAEPAHQRTSAPAHDHSGRQAGSAGRENGTPDSLHRSPTYGKKCGVRCNRLPRRGRHAG